MSFKRHRAQSEASSSSSSTSAVAAPTTKAQRTTPGPEDPATVLPLLCTLPPTCNHTPTPLANSKDLESHYATYHAHVCEEPACNCVFPDARLLQIHQTECHDPLAAVRKDRGEKIFACHLETCNRMFATPKARRLHLIQGHGYPKEYYFAVTNKGVGGLLKRWGEGASLMRGQWKPRDPQPEQQQQPVGHKRRDSVLVEEDDEDEEDESPVAPTAPPANEGMDTLTDSLNALSIVPPSIRFGRGGKNGGFSNEHVPRGKANRGRGGQQRHKDEMDVEVIPVDGHVPARGRGRGVWVDRGGAPSEALAYVPRGVRARGRGRAAPRGI
ncbi:hypothetical protein FB45DRAFT_926507 [Roridomyces roridus]|uniref:C2H2-type domain-containing protein n=1 Tax=Roridomyces roridus TaxID=1738132 RepID=A0AAD7FJL7_9AGAR|nr:hypothetical protein FB45DRAFT_926507 [Roridomyces roridus]